MFGSPEIERDEKMLLRVGIEIEMERGKNVE